MWQLDMKPYKCQRRLLHSSCSGSLFCHSLVLPSVNLNKMYLMSSHDMTSSDFHLCVTLKGSTRSETGAPIGSPSVCQYVGLVLCNWVCACVYVWVPCKGDTSSSSAVISPSFHRATFQVAGLPLLLLHATSISLTSAENCRNTRRRVDLSIIIICPQIYVGRRQLKI